MVENEEFRIMTALALEHTRALVLNADFRPLGMHPISTFSWQEAVLARMADRVTVLDEYDLTVRSERIEIRVPSVVALRDYVNLNRPAALTRQNLHAFHGPNCAYCGEIFPTRELTIDHVVPKSRFKGERIHQSNSFENLVLACVACNQKKGARTPQEARMRLRVELRHPTVAEINARAARFLKTDAMPKSWLDYLYWTSDLEP